MEARLLSSYLLRLRSSVEQNDWSAPQLEPSSILSNKNTHQMAAPVNNSQSCMPSIYQDQERLGMSKLPRFS